MLDALWFWFAKFLVEAGIAVGIIVAYVLFVLYMMRGRK